MVSISTDIEVKMETKEFIKMRVTPRRVVIIRFKRGLKGRCSDLTQEPTVAYSVSKIKTYSVFNLGGASYG